jgi:RimJ/RimL family protein N-acetyltransferase
MKSPIDLCEFLSWDSDFFGFRIGRITARSLSPSALSAIRNWSSANKIDCLYYIADSDDIQSIRLAEENGFRNVEIRITYELSLDGWDPDTRKIRNPDVHLRNASAEDLPTLIDMSKDSFVNSRWYFDPNFPKNKTRAYYPVWIRNSINGYADFVLAAELGGNVLGYISGNRAKSGRDGTLEIMAVRPEARGLGIGHELISGGLDWHVRDEAKEIVTNTQGRNITTNRMLIRLGWIIKDVQIYYHKWFSNQVS